MVDFIFSNGAGVSVTIKTDLIGIGSGLSLANAQNFTIMQFQDISGDTETDLFKNFQKLPNNVAAFIAFADANNLHLDAHELGGSAAKVTLIETDSE